MFLFIIDLYAPLAYVAEVAQGPYVPAERRQLLREQPLDDDLLVVQGAHPTSGSEHHLQYTPKGARNHRR